MKKEEYDVVIIGSGFAGLSAAIEAAEAGASVIVFEKMKAPGGNSIISDGGMAAPDTEYQQKEGIQDSPDIMYFDMFKAGGELSDHELLSVVVNKAKEAFYWTRDYLGVAYMDRVDIFGGHSVPRCYTPVSISGSSLIKKLLKKIENLQVDISYGSFIKKIIRDSSGVVTGVEILQGYRYPNNKPEANQVIYAKKGIVIASGGFSRDLSFRQSLDERLNENIQSTNKASATGEVLRECIRIGASTVDLDKIQLAPWTSPDEDGFGVGPLFADYIVLPYGILVETNRSTRFANELQDRDKLSEEILKQKKPVIGITDSVALNNSKWDISKALERKVVRSFQTLDELADNYEMDRELLKKTISRFNEMIDKNEDIDYLKPFPKEARRIEQGPFYGMRIWPKVHYTMGGLKIDPYARVLDLDQRPIPGLFAAGEVTGGVHGAARLGSCAITDCVVMGRIAGQEVAKRNKKIN